MYCLNLCLLEFQQFIWLLDYWSTVSSLPKILNGNSTCHSWDFLYVVLLHGIQFISIPKGLVAALIVVALIIVDILVIAVGAVCLARGQVSKGTLGKN